MACVLSTEGTATYKKDEEAANAVEEYLRKHGVSLDYVRIDSKNAEIQIKTPDGHKVVFAYGESSGMFAVRLC